MSDAHSAIIPADKARPIHNGSLIADCPFHETGRQMLYLYPAPPMTRPYFFCFCCGERGPFATNEDGSYTLRAPS
jgi:hypothetical protein